MNNKHVFIGMLVFIFSAPCIFSMVFSEDQVQSRITSLGGLRLRFHHKVSSSQMSHSFTYLGAEVMSIVTVV